MSCSVWSFQSIRTHCDYSAFVSATRLVWSGCLSSTFIYLIDGHHDETIFYAVNPISKVSDSGWKTMPDIPFPLSYWGTDPSSEGVFINSSTCFAPMSGIHSHGKFGPSLGIIVPKPECLNKWPDQGWDLLASSSFTRIFWKYSSMLNMQFLA